MERVWVEKLRDVNEPNEITKMTVRMTHPSALPGSCSGFLFVPRSSP
jgi:hypothetical protein